MHSFIVLRSTLAFTVLALAGCPKPAGTVTTPTGGTTTGGTSNANPYGTNMADAPVHPLPGQIIGKPACNERSYARVDAKGAAFVVTISVDKGCVMVGGLRDDGGQSAFGVEVCADKADGPHTLEMPAEPGKPMLTVNETGACIGSTATLVLK